MYYYKGIDEKGNIRVGIIDEADKNRAFELLKSQGIRPLELSKKRERGLFSNFFRIKPSDEEISYLLMQLSMMLSSGLTLTESLKVLHSHGENAKISNAILTIRDEIERGEPIALAFKKSGIFPEFFIEMLKVAERGENLEKICTMASEFLNRTSEIKNKVLSSLIYPLFVIIMSIISVILVTNLILPKISTILKGLGKELPLITKVMLIFSNGIIYMTYLLPLLITFFILRNKIFQRDILSLYLLRLPLIGKISYFFDLSRFSRMLSISLSSGIPFLKSIEISLGSISNYHIRNKLGSMINELARGKSLKEVFSSIKVFPAIYVDLISTGEKSGELPRVLNLIADIFDRKANRLINLWLRLIEPLAMLLIGVIVAFIIISVILPLTEISTGIKR